MAVTITWDGNTEGLLNIGVNYRVSDRIFTPEELTTYDSVYIRGDETKTETNAEFFDYGEAFGFPKGLYMGVQKGFFFPTESGGNIGVATVVTSDCDIEGEKYLAGVYFPKGIVEGGGDGYFTSLTIINATEETKPFAEITYNGETIAQLNAGETCTLKCAGLPMETDIIIKINEVN